MVFAETNETHEPVAVAAAEWVASGWMELGWVAVAPAHRGQGLGLAVCSSLIARLTLADESRLWGSTQDHRLAALRIYFTLGFHPVFRACRRDKMAFRERELAPPSAWGGRS